jgi:MEMO1 family protein
MQPSTDVRQSPIAGRWYPAEPDRLAASIDGFLNQARLPKLDGEVIAVIAPHAGHRYSGPVAGFAFAAIKGRSPDLVVILSPMHYPHSDPLLTSGHRAYQTPLGIVEIDRVAVQQVSWLLEESVGFGLTPVLNDPEHSLEIELPFLQRALSNEFNLLPVMVRDHSQRTAQALGAALGEFLKDKQALLVGSTDLSHFFAQPVAEKLDRELIRRVEAFDPEAVLAAEDEGVGFACGKGALAATLWAASALGADRAKLLSYATSGKITGDYSQVVGYAAAVCLRAN